MENDKGPVQTFREGAIGVSIWEREGREGPFFDFTLSRSYKKSEEEAGYSGKFAEYNEQAIFFVVRQACEWIREQPAQASEQDAAA